MARPRFRIHMNRPGVLPMRPNMIPTVMARIAGLRPQTKLPFHRQTTRPCQDVNYHNYISMVPIAVLQAYQALGRDQGQVPQSKMLMPHNMHFVRP